MTDDIDNFVPADDLVDSLAGTTIALEVLVAFIIIGVFVIIGTLIVFSILLYKSSKLKNPAPVVAAVSMLSTLALLVYAFTQSAEAATLAATGFGALGGAMTSLFKTSDAVEEAKEYSQKNLEEGMKMLKEQKEQLEAAMAEKERHMAEMFGVMKVEEPTQEIVVEETPPDKSV